MTDVVKKAIEQLRRISNSLASIGETVDYTDVAIQALEQQPCEDCIRIEDAIGIVSRIKENHISDREQHPINYGTICDIDLALQKLPLATPSRPKGRWIHNNCSICGYVVNPWNNTPYCPNCGADMRGDEDDKR